MPPYIVLIMSIKKHTMNVKWRAMLKSKGVVTTAINIFARKVVRENRIPFEISGDVPNKETVEAIQEVKRMKANPNLGKTYSNVDQMMEELLADV